MSKTNAVVELKGARRRPGTVWVLALLLLLCGPASRASGVFLTMDATKGEGNTVKLCIGLDAGGQKVAGTQNDLIWDSSCSSLKSGSCAAVPDSKKPLHGNAPANLQSTYRALVFALDNVDPIRDGKLYCCDFELTGQGDKCCPVKLERLGASDPVGTALPTSGNPDNLCLAGGAPPAGAPPAAPADGALKPSPEGGKWLWLVLIGVAVVLVGILILRGRSS